MLLRKALRKMLITTMSLFIIMTIYLIPMTGNEKTLSTNLELEYITGLGNHSIYLLNEEDYLVKTRILLDSTDPIQNIKTMILNLTENDSSKFPQEVTPIIPKGTKLLDIVLEDKRAILNFSKELLKVTEEKEKKLVESLVYSLTELKEVKEVQLKVEGEVLTKYPHSKEALDEVLTRKIGINKNYQLTSTKDINKVVIYYVESRNQTDYYVPVTKYVNDARDKINIIVEELTTGYIYEPNLMSLLNEETKLTNYTILDGVMILDFNEALFDKDGTMKEEVLYTLSYSIFDNYDVSVASFRVNDKEVANVKRSELP